jgi:plasmid stabilization system protein ParE
MPGRFEMEWVASFRGIRKQIRHQDQRKALDLMTKVTFSPRSRQDLLDIGDHIAKDSRVNARRFVGKLMERCQSIGTSPMGYVGREDLAPGLRMAALGRYVSSPKVSS